MQWNGPSHLIIHVCISVCVCNRRKVTRWAEATNSTSARTAYTRMRRIYAVNGSKCLDYYSSSAVLWAARARQHRWRQRQVDLSDGASRVFECDSLYTTHTKHANNHHRNRRRRRIQTARFHFDSNIFRRPQRSSRRRNVRACTVHRQPNRMSERSEPKKVLGRFHRAYNALLLIIIQGVLLKIIFWPLICIP